MEMFDPPPPMRSRPTSAREAGRYGGAPMGAGERYGTSMMGAGANGGRHGEFRRYPDDRSYSRSGGGGFYRNDLGMSHHQHLANENQFQAMNSHSGPPPPMMAAAVAAAQRMARLGGGGGGGPFPPLGLAPNMIHHHHPLPAHPLARGGRGGIATSPPPRSRMAMTKGDWIPLTKLGRLVKEMKIKSLEEVFLYDLPILEPEIFDHFLGITIKEEVLAVVPTDKTLPTGERCVRFKALAVAGDCNGHVGLGVQISKEVAVAIAGASLAAKLNIIPIRRGFWGRPQAMTNQSLDRPHTLPCKVNGSFGSVTVRLVPAPRGSGCGSAPLVVQRILLLAGVEDAYFLSHGPTLDLGFLCKATLNALRETFAHFQEEVFRITQATQHHMTPEMEELLQHMDINDSHRHNNDATTNINNNNSNASLPWNSRGFGQEGDIKKVNRRLLEAQIHRDLGLKPPANASSGLDAAFEGTRPFDGGYNPLQMLHRSLKQQQQQQQKFLPSGKRGPQLPPIPMRKRCLIPIVAPPLKDDDNIKISYDCDDGADTKGDDIGRSSRVQPQPQQHTTTHKDTAPEVCLSLRPLPSMGTHEEDEESEVSPSTSADSQLDSPWRSLAPAFKPTASAFVSDSIDASAATESAIESEPASDNLDEK